MTNIYQHKEYAVHYASKLGYVFKNMMYSPAGVAGFIPLMVGAELSTNVKAAYVLMGLFVLDFITGVWASWAEFQRSIPVTPGSGKRYVVQSGLLQLTAVKFVVYGLTILVALALEWAFIAPGKEFEPHESLNKMTLTTFWILFLCIIEVYSIVFENIKRIGFDVIQTIKKIAKNGWDIYKTVKDEKTE